MISTSPDIFVLLLFHGKKFLSDIDLIFSARSFKRSVNVSGKAILAKKKLKNLIPKFFSDLEQETFRAMFPNFFLRSRVNFFLGTIFVSQKNYKNSLFFQTLSKEKLVEVSRIDFYLLFGGVSSRRYFPCKMLWIHIFFPTLSGKVLGSPVKIDLYASRKVVRTFFFWKNSKWKFFSGPWQKVPDNVLKGYCFSSGRPFFPKSSFKKLFRTLSKDKIVVFLKSASRIQSKIWESFFKAGFFCFKKYSLINFWTLSKTVFWLLIL